MTNEIEQNTTDLPSENSQNSSILRGIEADLQNTEEREHLESELRLTLEEIARLQNALADTEMKLVTYQNQLTLAYPPDEKKVDIFDLLLKEINQPLITILNYCELLQNSNVGTLSALQKKFLNRIASSARQIRLMSDQFEANLPSKEKKTKSDEDLINISTLLNQVIEPRTSFLEQKQLTLQMVISERIPEFVADKQKLHEILDILISNALDTTPNDSIVKINANILNIYKERALQIVVKDGGPGISLSDLDDLFARKSLPGQIIPGLSISCSQVTALNQLIVEQKGSLNIRNGLDYGAIFEVNLPLKQS